ncbi:MAG: T9SS type A sorting domain-containing protein [Lewinellaceae bacterium]|nr:T9SS type A sorting domain-containing protein [Lewinellaceae bacterium]
MKNIRSIFFLLTLWCASGSQLLAQDANCAGGATGTETYTGGIFFNYGSVTGAFNNKNRHNSSVGEPLVGTFYNQYYSAGAGFWMRFVAPPTAPSVVATQGDLLDRIQLRWAVDPLSPSFDGGFNIYRDGIFLASVDKNTRSYNDFNVIAGQPYNYEVRGVNIYGEGVPGKALGFQVPNGVVTGLVETVNGSPVPGALVTLMPMQGFSAKFGATDGAFAEADTSVNTLLPILSQWSLAFWIKTNTAAANAGVIQFAPYSLYIQALNSAGAQEGIMVNAPGVAAGTFSVNFPDSTKNAWHHIALTYSNNQGQLYLDGVLADISAMNAPAGLTTDLNLGARTTNGGWQGRMDELRIYTRKLDELDLGEIMEGTASSTTPGLMTYWKMDEEQGSKSFDVVRRNKLYFCGAQFDTDRPPVRTSAITNDDGYYRIESASYGTGTTFLAEPFKNFYRHRALKFNRSMLDYATLPDFSLPPKATIEAWVNNASPNGNQVILSKKWDTSNEFRLVLTQSGTDNIIRIHFNGVNQDFGLLGNGYQHLAFTIDSSGADRTVTGYKNGAPIGSFTFSGISGNWSDTTETWLLGTRKQGAGYTAFFDGLIDEVAFYDTTLTEAKIQEHAQISRDPQERGLHAYFSFDEGSGNRLNNSGSLLTGSGTSFGTEWSPFAPNQSTTPHEFTPTTRQVTLNPSVTSVDQVDFTDRSTVAVSGFVRYKNTDCFAEQVEILINGESYSPPIFSDSTGKFLIDLDPGATVTLSPKFEDHVFTPAFWDLANVVNPVAGILFNDITTRKITGQVAGGECRKPVLKNVGTPQGTVCTVKVRSTDGCFERIITLDNEEGKFEFGNLPPIAMTVAVTEHSDPAIKTFFQVSGGITADLTQKDTAVTDFIYYAPPVIEVSSGLEAYSPDCQVIVMDQFEQKTMTIRLKEVYAGGDCYVDTAHFKIINGFADELKDTAMSMGTLQYTFTVGVPNSTPPYLKTMQIVATPLSGNETSLVVQAVVTGTRIKETTFTTKLPETPFFVLHDPPGDGSYAFIEKNTTICNETSVGFAIDTANHGGVQFNTLPELEIVLPLIGTVEDFTPLLGGSGGGIIAYQDLTDTIYQTCITFDERVSTNDGDLIVGDAQGGDVFVGFAQNLKFGNIDEVTFEDCEASVIESVFVSPGDFATKFIYSEFEITEYVIPNLEKLASDPGTSPDDASTYNLSIQRWNQIIADNRTRKDTAQYNENITFGSGSNYEYSITSDTTNTTLVSSDSIRGSEGEFVAGVYFNNAGFNAYAQFSKSRTFSRSAGTEAKSGVTVGYTLNDDDMGDFFTFDVGLDPVYNTPIFRLAAGQSSCPWEPGTAHREGCLLSMRDGDGPVKVDVPANEPAVFKMTLSNTSSTNETWTYALTAGPESNPHGAQIKVNGGSLNGYVLYAIPWGTSIPVTITLERGPEEYDYDSLEVVFYSLCEDERATALGIAPDDHTILYSPIYISAHFIRPCSEVAINVPEQDWVIFPDPLTPGPDNERRITVSGYDTTVTDFQLVRVQYRRSDGDGAWINIPGISDRYNPNWSGYAALPNPKPPVLQPTFTQFFWETEGLSDGPYEIRAVAVCTGDASDKPGFSQVIKGRIDREPPSLVGVPQPSDGVYQVGDEISFTFNKHINCDKLIPADVTQPNNVGLYDAVSGELIDIAVTCFENKIVLDPSFQNEFFENHILRAELHDIQDKTGNTLLQSEWEFYVDRNELAWLTDSAGMTKNEGETKTVTASIHNRGGYPVPFTITGAPDWVRVVPNSGTLVANEVRPITFEVDSTLAFGHWADTIVLHTETGLNPFFMGGDEPLPFGVRVVCRPPDWDLDAGIYPVTMNMVVKPDIEGEFSLDAEDIVAAYIGDELRGRAHVMYVPQVNQYLAYLTIYGESDESGEPVLLQIWDASACLRYGTVQEVFTFQPDNVIGTPIAPQMVHTNSLVLREIPFSDGWNWVSFNLAFPDPMINPTLASLNHPDNDLIKGQSVFSMYSSGWFGSLTSLTNTTMYQFRADQPDTLNMLGNLIDPSSVNIPLVSGWNWLGYLPNFALPVNEALSSLTPQNGDIIKSQTAFAQYISGFGWLGNLKFMQPPLGYQIRLGNAGALTYPDDHFKPDGPVDERGDPTATAFWQVNPAQYEHSMTLIGMRSQNGENTTPSNTELGAFAGGELRGAAQAVWVEPLGAHLYFLTTYANTTGELLHFKLYDPADGSINDLSETMYFASDLHQGTIEDPVPFTLQTSAIANLSISQRFDIQPNPFNEATTLLYDADHGGELDVFITDVSGRALEHFRWEVRQGKNVYTWLPEKSLPAGVYFVKMESAEGTMARKVVRE